MESRYKEILNLEDNIMAVYKLKTAFYSIIGALSLGLILGGIDDQILNDIKNFGEKIGIAFQIQDVYIRNLFWYGKSYWLRY